MKKKSPEYFEAFLPSSLFASMAFHMNMAISHEVPIFSEIP